MSLDDLPAALERNTAIQTAQDLIAELRLGRTDQARRLHGVLGEQLDVVEAVEARSEEASGEHAG